MHDSSFPESAGEPQVAVGPRREDGRVGTFTRLVRVGFADLVTGHADVAAGHRLVALAGGDELRVALEGDLEDLVIGSARRRRRPDDAAGAERRVERTVGVEARDEEVAVVP